MLADRNHAAPPSHPRRLSLAPQAGMEAYLLRMKNMAAKTYHPQPPCCQLVVDDAGTGFKWAPRLSTCVPL